jgi:hypothetical protein
MFFEGLELGVLWFWNLSKTVNHTGNNKIKNSPTHTLGFLVFFHPKKQITIANFIQNSGWHG